MSRAPPSPGGSPGHEHHAVLYRERMPLPVLPWAVTALVLVFLYGVYRGMSDGDALWVAMLWAGISTGAVGAVLLIVWALPVIGDGKVIQVDGAGLRVGGRRLPVAAVGRLTRVRDHRLSDRAWLWRGGGERIRFGRLFVHGGITQLTKDRGAQGDSGSRMPEALLIEDLRAVRRGSRSPHWAVQARDVRRLHHALRQARDGV